MGGEGGGEGGLQRLGEGEAFGALKVYGRERRKGDGVNLGGVGP